MTEYIERADAVRTVLEKPDMTPDEKAGVVRRLQALPAADVAPVRHGRWINGRCSECGEHAPFWSMASTYHLSKYCHGCGARCDL